MSNSNQEKENADIIDRLPPEPEVPEVVTIYETFSRDIKNTDKKEPE